MRRHNKEGIPSARFCLIVGDDCAALSWQQSVERSLRGAAACRRLGCADAHAAFIQWARTARASRHGMFGEPLGWMA